MFCFSLKLNRYYHVLPGLVNSLLLFVYHVACLTSGMVNWYAVHGTSMNNTNKFISGDNKGYAEQVSVHDAWLQFTCQPPTTVIIIRCFVAFIVLLRCFVMLFCNAHSFCPLGR